jgi:serine/threonine protein kinase
MNDFLRNLFGEASRRNEPQREGAPTFQKNDLIAGEFEVLRTLGKGGFGVVLLVYSRKTCEVAALKTFQNEFLANPAARHAFKKEALIWLNLERHPFIVAASIIVGDRVLVTEGSGRLFLLLEFIAPDAQGRVSLADHLARTRGPLDANQVLKWAIQFCIGMEHAQAHGVLLHRDIKPSNILITQDGTLKITDFGLAAGAEAAWRTMSGQGASFVTGGKEGGLSFSLMQADGKATCGTPGYMAPEVYRCETADVRSDIYSFGLVLAQMAAGNPLPPFMVPWRGDMGSFCRGIYELQTSGRMPSIEDPLRTVVHRCLRPSRSERFGSFQELRGALEPIWESRTGRKFETPQIEGRTADFWLDRSYSLSALGRHEEAVRCCDKALAIEPRHAFAWGNKGAALSALGRDEESNACYDKALAIDPQEAGLWSNKGMALNALGRHEESLVCFEKALAINPLHPRALCFKAATQDALGNRREAARSYRKFIEIASPQNGLQIVAMVARARLRVRELESAGNSQ